MKARLSRDAVILTDPDATGESSIDLLAVNLDPEASSIAAIAALRNDKFNSVATEYRRALVFFVLKRVGNPDEAEEIAQQALVEAAMSYHRFRGDAELSTWIFGIALNLTRNYLSRSPQRRHVFESDEVLEETEAPRSDPCAHLMYREALRHLDDVMLRLPDGAAQALLMVAVDGLSYEETARQLGVPVGTIRSRVSRARAEVRLHLSDHVGHG